MEGGLINNENDKKVKSYNKTKIAISLFNSIFIFLLLAFFVFSGLSKDFALYINQLFDNAYLSLILFVSLILVIEAILTFPFSFYSGYVLEHKYNLSNQTFFQWLIENIKSFLLGFIIFLPILLSFYYIIRNHQNFWWFWIGIVIFIFTILLARLAPVIIFPLFYKFYPLENESLKNRIMNLCNKTKIQIKGIFTFNLSKETKKANAGFTGIGKSKRIIISDTLLNNFSEEEIEVVFAHELGHYIYHHIWIGMIINTILTFIGLYLVSIIYSKLIVYFEFNGIDDLAALPLLALLLTIYGIILLPLSNFISRMNEKKADSFAIELTNNFSAFESTMLKLSELNLSDKSPNKIIEILFYSHPSINNRIKYIKEKFKIND